MSQVVQSGEIRWIQVAKILISVLSVVALGIVAVGIIQVNVDMWNKFGFFAGTIFNYWKYYFDVISILVGFDYHFRFFK